MQRFYSISFITEIIYVIEAKNVNKDSPILLKGNHLNFFSPGTSDSVWKGMMDYPTKKMLLPGCCFPVQRDWTIGWCYSSFPRLAFASLTRINIQLAKYIEIIIFFTYVKTRKINMKVIFIIKKPSNYLLEIGAMVENQKLQGVSKVRSDCKLYFPRSI